MSDLKLDKRELKGENGETVSLVYDETGDILEISFGENEPATGIELTDHILLRLNQTTGRIVSLTLHHFSVLTEKTEYGPRNYPINQLEELPEELRETVVRAATSPPVNQFLKFSFFQESATRHIPFTYVEPHHLASGA